MLEEESAINPSVSISLSPSHLKIRGIGDFTEERVLHASGSKTSSRDKRSHKTTVSAKVYRGRRRRKVSQLHKYEVAN